MGRNGLQWTIIYEKSSWDETVSNLENIAWNRLKYSESILLHWQESFTRKVSQDLSKVN